jgi:hypothetical protein
VAVVANPKGAETSLARFPFDSSFSVASAGAAVRPMAFEFVVPRGFEPIAIYLKNIRQLLSSGQPVEEFSSVGERDSAVEQGMLIEGAEPIPANFGQEDSQDRNPGGNDRADEAERNGIDVTNSLGRKVTLQAGNEKSLRVSEGKVLEGEEKWTPAEVSTRVVAQELRIDRFNVDQGVVMVQVDVSPSQPLSLLGQAAAAAERVVPPVLVDANGTAYEAVGWIYKDRDLIYIRYTPGQPIRGLQELQDKRIVLSSSREDQELTLLFLCSLGAEIESFKIGNRDILTLDEPVKLDRAQK